MDRVNKRWKELVRSKYQIDIMCADPPAIDSSWKQPLTAPPPKVCYPDGYTPHGNFDFFSRSIRRTVLSYSAGHYYQQEVIESFNELKPEVLQ